MSALLLISSDMHQSVFAVYLTRGGCCKDSCLMNYGDLPRKRANTLWTLDKKIKKAVVLGMLAVIRDTSGSIHSSIALTGGVLSATLLSVPSLAQVTIHCSRCALTRTLSPIPMATVAGHPTMPSLVWTGVERSCSLETMQP